MWYMVVVYLLIPTSNHNLNLTNKIQSEVVYLLIPTSNHNVKQWHSHVLKLYIFWFLHQTTTRLRPALILGRCISFDSYIKPQRLSYWWRLADVVYLLIPTSNHNFDFYHNAYIKLYIFWFLHQTTTLRPVYRLVERCISFDSYIKPQHAISWSGLAISCISFDSYIKPQR